MSDFFFKKHIELLVLSKKIKVFILLVENIFLYNFPSTLALMLKFHRELALKIESFIGPNSRIELAYFCKHTHTHTTFKMVFYLL